MPPLITEILAEFRELVIVDGGKEMKNMKFKELYPETQRRITDFLSTRLQQVYLAGKKDVVDEIKKIASKNTDLDKAYCYSGLISHLNQP